MFFKLPKGEIVLIDGGPASAGERVVSYLKKSGVKKIDLLIATHPHEDHMGGLISVLDSIPVSKVWDSGHNIGTITQIKFLERVKMSKSRFEIVRAGFTERIGDVKIEVIPPAFPQNNANNSSIITHVSWKNMSFLLMGDAEHKDRRTIDRYPRSTVLKLAHHGSRNGTTRSLLQKVKPRMAVVSYEENNSFGHPHKEVLKLLQEFNVKLYSTVEGNIVIESNGENYSVNYAVEEQGIIDMIKSVLDIFFKW
ncbi:MAG: MBL fold metallo-hydrolase [Synergistaceae bacterium]|nr:MBL fold metallo-hydrolase [Synergistaceae bacterium]